MAHPNPLAEALSGLLVLALDRPRAEHGRLIEQFLAQYPEIMIAPTWSKTLPTEPGFYWLGSPGEGGPLSPDIVDVEEVDGELMVARIGDEDPYPIEENDGDLWAGPLPEPRRTPQ